MPNGWFDSEWKEILACVLYRAGTLGLSRPFSCRTAGSPESSRHRVVDLGRRGDTRKRHPRPRGLASGSYVRAAHYELFLLSHVVLSVLVVVGCWYHPKRWLLGLGRGLKVESSPSPDDRPGVGITLLIKHTCSALRQGSAYAGGIGIPDVLPWAFQQWNVKLMRSVAESARCLTDAIHPSGVVNRKVRVGRRFDVDELVNGEVAAGWERIGVAVSGPGSPWGDVRAAVAAAARRGKTVFELEVDAY
ncbi:hypothetical protein C8A03DRAFT_37728 [Achaetomium macrosporum]|uniref:Uncharacterized protein n=1 Tax=Achaetomium macrosporum TaxID=79813 RepID=A0AAN7C347_9PEZI|nr:hypothetical protein C8A03DRAFT_37728 [Achaetomium macrosporum]